jgi:hypothetical protein
MDGDADLVGKQRGELEGEGAKHGCEVIRGVRCLLFHTSAFSIFYGDILSPYPSPLEIRVFCVFTFF